MSKFNYEPTNAARHAEWQNRHHSRQLLRALESETQLLRYWMLQTLYNYRAWRRNMTLTPAYAAQTRKDIQKLIKRSWAEYRRKQQIQRDICSEYPYLSVDDVRDYQSINHFHDVMENIAGNDNSTGEK